MKLEIPTFKERKELFKFLIENEKTLIAQKKSEIKHADGINSGFILLKDVKATNKQAGGDSGNEDLKVKAIINTTNIMDSHDDVHIKGLWTKSLKENKNLMHVQEHKSNEFKSIISSGDDLKAYAKTYTWKELGFDLEGETQALVFDSIVKFKRNPYMHEQYKEGYVDNHSVGMYYVSLELAINDKEEEAYYETWKKYIGEIANKEYAESKGYFYAITEAKAIEGSAVPRGSNPLTPTQSVKTDTPQLQLSESEAKAEAIKKWLKS